MRVAVQMVQENLLTEREALMRINAVKCASFCSPKHLPSPSDSHLHFTGLAASQGVVHGALAFTEADCLELRSQSRSVIFCKTDSKDVNLHTLKWVSGIVTLGGSLVSTTSILCRNLAKPCVAALHDATIRSTGNEDDEMGATNQLVCGKTGGFLKMGDYVTLDGTRGELFAGLLETESAYNDPDFLTVLKWADKHRRLKIFASVSGLCFAEAHKAYQMGADGLGYVNTNMMFCSTDERLSLMRSVLFCQSPEESESPLQKLEEIHRQDFVAIFRTSHHKRVSIGLLDYSPQYFLPVDSTEADELQKDLSLSTCEFKRKIAKMHESDPTVGLRGCRLSCLIPEITEMQTRAVISAVIDVATEGIIVQPIIAVSMLCNQYEAKRVVDIITKTCTVSILNFSSKFNSLIGFTFSRTSSSR
jgi:pyruvate,orthophosphate dikinase